MRKLKSYSFRLVTFGATVKFIFADFFHYIPKTKNKNKNKLREMTSTFKSHTISKIDLFTKQTTTTK